MQKVSNTSFDGKIHKMSKSFQLSGAMTKIVTVLVTGTMGWGQLNDT